MSQLIYHFLSGKRDEAAPARMRLVVYGFAGGSVRALLSLVKRLPAWVEVWGAEYPGRGLRWKAAPVHRLHSLLDDLAPGLDALCDRPLVLLGYSMGANVAYRLGLRLRGRVGGVIALSAAPPCRQGHTARVHAGGDEELLAHLKGLGGIPDEILASRIIMDAFLPVVRADLACCADMSLLPAPPLSCPVLVMHGDDDRVVGAGDAPLWLRVGGGQARHGRHQVYPGGHFFHHGAEQRVAGDIARWLDQLMGPPRHESQALPSRDADRSVNHV